LQAFNLIKTTGDTLSAVFEFVNGDLSEMVVQGMNKIDIAGNKLSVQRVPHSSAAALLKNVATIAPATATIFKAVPVIEAPVREPTTVICLSNMTTVEDLQSDDSYEELIEDVSEECNKYAVVKKVIVPRGQKGQGSDPSIGKIFVHVTDTDGAGKVLKAVAGRRFNGKVVKAEYFPEELFLNQVCRSDRTLSV
jgi:splicing factor U2AF 65 kDa subunit